ncbi:MAG: hypothetical protein JXO22_03950 [Phycisphaerae bacterium]|nr:hypothetical protein [Phycisphaerae bacterium]
MSASLVEIVMAMVLAGLVFVGAMVPTTQTVVTFQRAEADSLQDGAQFLAARRVQQLAASVWRAADAPYNHALITEADHTRMTVGDWSIRERKNQVWLEDDSAGGAPLAGPVSDFELDYCVGGGKWVQKVSTAGFGSIVALRCAWTHDGRTYRTVVAPTDAWLAGRTLALPAAEEGKAIYRRSSYMSTVELDVEPWE